MNPYKIVDEFEKTIAEYAGSKYAVAVESGTAAIFLSCQLFKPKLVILPKFTYPSVPASVIHAGGEVVFHDGSWKGIYQLKPYKIWDGALRFRKDMYRKETLHCLSFHIKKHIPIGRGGMILTDSKLAYEWLKMARFDGRKEAPLETMTNTNTILGWNMYMTPEQAARGLQLFNLIKDKDLPDLDSTKQGYPDLSQFDCYK